MASLVVRGLDDSVKQALAERAKAHGRSMEAEVRSILSAAARPANVGLALWEATRAEPVDDLVIPVRADEARAVAFE